MKDAFRLCFSFFFSSLSSADVWQRHKTDSRELFCFPKTKRKEKQEEINFSPGSIRILFFLCLLTNPENSKFVFRQQFGFSSSCAQAAEASFCSGALWRATTMTFPFGKLIASDFWLSASIVCPTFTTTRINFRIYDIFFDILRSLACKSR